MLKITQDKNTTYIESQDRTEIRHAAVSAVDVLYQQGHEWMKSYHKIIYMASDADVPLVDAIPDNNISIVSLYDIKINPFKAPKEWRGPGWIGIVSTLFSDAYGLVGRGPDFLTSAMYDAILQNEDEEENTRVDFDSISQALSAKMENCSNKPDGRRDAAAIQIVQNTVTAARSPWFAGNDSIDMLLEGNYTVLLIDGGNVSVEARNFFFGLLCAYIAYRNRNNERVAIVVEDAQEVLWGIKTGGVEWNPFTDNSFADNLIEHVEACEKDSLILLIDQSPSKADA